MTNISSVSIGQLPIQLQAPGYLILMGLVAGYIGLFWVQGSSRPLLILGGLALLAFGIWLLIQMLRTTYTVRIGAAGGETDGFQSENLELVKRIVDAINEAIIDRG